MKIGIAIGVAIGLAVATLIFIGSIIFWSSIFRPVSPITTTVITTPQSPADLQTQVDSLTRRVDKLENDVSFNLQDMAWKTDQKLLILSFVALVISSFAGFLGFKTYSDLNKTIRTAALLH